MFLSAFRILHHAVVVAFTKYVAFRSEGLHSLPTANGEPEFS